MAEDNPFKQKPIVDVNNKLHAIKRDMTSLKVD